MGNYYLFAKSMAQNPSTHFQAGSRAVEENISEKVPFLKIEEIRTFSPYTLLTSSRKVSHFIRNSSCFSTVCSFPSHFGACTFRTVQRSIVLLNAVIKCTHVQVPLGISISCCADKTTGRKRRQGQFVLVRSVSNPDHIAIHADITSIFIDFTAQFSVGGVCNAAAAVVAARTCTTGYVLNAGGGRRRRRGSRGKIVPYSGLGTSVGIAEGRRNPRFHVRCVFSI